MEDTEENRNFVRSTQMTTTGLFGTLVGTFILQMFLTGALAYMIGWVGQYSAANHPLTYAQDHGALKCECFLL